MKLAVLFSGGKDSNFALYEASKYHEIVCLITIKSVNPESYMFQTQGINFTKYQAECLEIPQIEFLTKGEKEKELDDLKLAIKKAKDKYKIEGIVTGAIGSIYQASRVQKICDELNLWCFNPLWQKNEHKFLEELIKEKFEVMIVGVYAYPLTKKYIGKILDKKLLNEFYELEKKYLISPAFEGGEAESFVIDSPLFKKKMKIEKYDILEESENAITMNIKKIEILEK